MARVRWLVSVSFVVILLVIAPGLMPGETAAATDVEVDRVGHIGSPDRLVLRGLVSIDRERLRRPLLADDELLRLSRPECPRQSLLEGYALKAEQSLKRAGFATARVVAAVETIDGVEHVVLTMNEGSRLEAGEVVVHGLPAEMAGRLKAYLQEYLPEESAVPEVIDRPDGSQAVVWLDRNGRRSKYQAPSWPRSGFPECHDGAIERVRAQVTRFLKEEGYLSIAPPETPGVKRRYETFPSTITDAGIKATVDGSDGKTAKLVVTVSSLPSQAMLTRIELPRHLTTSEEELASFLGIRVGAPVTQRDRLNWIGRLRDSARFLRHDVVLIADPLDPTGMIARFDLDEFAPMMPLSRPLTREEEALLRGRRWLLETIDSDQELVLKGTVCPGMEDKLAPFELIVSATRGTALLIGGEGGTPQGVVTSPGRVRLIAPNGAGWFDFSHLPRKRFSLILRLWFTRSNTSPASASRSTDGDSIEQKVGFSFSNSPAMEAPAGFGVTLDFPPSACAVMLHGKAATTRWEGEELVVERTGQSPTRVDAITGRIRSLDFEAYHVTIDQRPDAIAGAEKAAASSGIALADPERPFTSALRFIANDLAPGATEAVSSLRGTPEEPRKAWRRVIAIAARVIGNWDRTDALAPLDRWLVNLASASSETKSDEDLAVPYLGLTGAQPTSGLFATVASFAWHWSEKNLGATAWPTAIARVSVSSSGGKERFREDLDAILAADHFGPLAHLGLAMAFRTAPLSATFARRGLERCSIDAFHADCRPFLDTATAIHLDSLVVGLLEGLDDEAIRDLGTWLAGDPEMLLPLAAEIRRGELTASGGTQATLDAWWEAGFGQLVVRCLERLSTPASSSSGESTAILALEPMFPESK